MPARTIQILNIIMSMCLMKMILFISGMQMRRREPVN